MTAAAPAERDMGDGNMSDFQKNSERKDSDLVYWLIALGLVFTGVAAPVGVLMIVMKMLGGGRKKGRHPYYEQQGQERAGSHTSARSAQEAPVWEAPAAPARKQTPLQPKKKKGRDLISELDKKGRTWAIAGGAVAAGCMLGFIGGLGDAMYWLFDGEFSWFLRELMDLIILPCISAGGLGFVWAGLRKRKQASRFRGYLAMVGNQSSGAITWL